MKILIDDGEDGFIYPFHEAHLLAHKVCTIFEDDALAERFSEKGRLHAEKTYNREENGRKLLSIYETIQKQSNKDMR